MESILHIFGTCSDNHVHLDLSDLFLAGGTASYTYLYFKYHIHLFWLIIKNYFKTNKSK